MEKLCPICGMMFGSHAPGCPNGKNPFAEVERLVVPKPGADTAREKQVRKARTMLRLAENLRHENAAKEHRLGSDPELEMMAPDKRWEAVRQSLDGKIERLAGKIQDAKDAVERRRLMARFKGMTSFKGKVEKALAGGINEDEDAALMRDPDSVYALGGGDTVSGIDRDLMLEENESLQQATGKLANALEEFDVAQGRVEQEEQSSMIKPEEQEELDKGLDARLKKAYKFIARERLAEAEVSKIDVWLDGNPEAETESLDKIPLNEALRRLSFFRDELWRIEHLPEKTDDEKETKNLERKRLAVWRDALLKRVGTPKLDLRLWDVAERAEELEKADILHFDEAEKRRMDVLWVARRIADNGLSDKILEKLLDAKGKMELSENEARIILTTAIKHDFKVVDSGYFRDYVSDAWHHKPFSSRQIAAECLVFEGLNKQNSHKLLHALALHLKQSWARALFDVLFTKEYVIKRLQPLSYSRRISIIDKQHLGLAYACLTRNMSREKYTSFDKKNFGEIFSAEDAETFYNFSGSLMSEDE